MSRLMVLIAALVLAVSALVAFSTRDLTDDARLEIQPAPGVEPTPYEETP